MVRDGRGVVRGPAPAGWSAAAWAAECRRVEARRAIRSEAAPVARPRVAVLDTETTGLPRHPMARVVEVAVVVLDESLSEVACFSSLVRATEAEIADGARALAVNGIDGASLLVAPPAAEVGVVLAGWLKLQGVESVSAFNNGFDRMMMGRAFVGELGVPWGECIMEAAMEVMGSAGALPARRWRGGQEWRWPSLGEAMEFFGVEREGVAHRGLSDARAAAGVWRGVMTSRGS